MTKYLVFMVLVLLFGCSNSDNSKGSFDTDSFPQTWELKVMSFGLSGQILRDDDLPYKEVIILNNFGDFEKTRTLTDSLFKGKGTFIFNKSEANILLVLNYDSETNLIQSCGGEKLVETLIMTSNNSLFGGSSPCDGPGLSFIRIE